MNASSIGNGPASIRSINVGANLLSEWTSNQIRFRSEANRYALGIGICLLALAVGIPTIAKARTAHESQIKQHQVALAELKGHLDQANAAKTAVEPKIATTELIAQTSSYFNRLLGELYAVLESGKSGIAFSSAKIEVRAAEILITCRADAESYESAATFAETAGQTPNKVSTLSSTRPSELLSPIGISFEYLKRVPVQ
ncbi:MAG: hypothetical protein HONBIEJF_00316 [Fimbriimonadaceae bacterium]|nr:hypothetical protein [Fimbriimonadaceae bacterium]